MACLVCSAASRFYFCLWEPLRSDIYAFQTVHNNWRIKINFKQDNSQVWNAKLTVADTQKSADVVTKLSLKRIKCACAGSLKVQQLKEQILWI